MATRHNVADVSELPPGKALLTEVAGKPVALFNVDGKIFALDNTCPHRGGPLSEGDLIGNEINCPWHAWGFDIATGVCGGDPDLHVTAHEVRVDGERVMVRLS